MARYKINPEQFKHMIIIERHQKIKDEDNRFVEQWKAYIFPNIFLRYKPEQ